MKPLYKIFLAITIAVILTTGSNNRTATDKNTDDQNVANFTPKCSKMDRFS